MNIAGVYTALITPFNNDQSIDWSGLEKLIEFQITAGVQGLLLLGTTAETPTLTMPERQAILEAAIKQIAGRLPVMVGAGSNSTSETITNCQLAQELGADSVLVVSPYYNKPTQEGLLQHYQAVTQNLSIPLIVYNIMGRTGVNINNDTMAKIAALPNVIGVKEASGNLDQIMTVISTIQNQQTNFSLSSGDDALTFPIISCGGRGVISVVSNFLPKAVVALTKAALAEDTALARKLHYQLLPVFKQAFVETNPAPIKFLMQANGLPAGPCRLPLCELQPESKKLLEKLLKTINL